MRLLVWLTLHHQCLFCAASVYLERENKKAADEYFDKADQVRREILGPAEQGVLKRIQFLTQVQNHTGVEDKVKSKDYVIADCGLSGFALFGIQEKNSLFKIS